MLRQRNLRHCNTMHEVKHVISCDSCVFMWRMPRRFQLIYTENKKYKVKNVRINFNSFTMSSFFLQWHKKTEAINKIWIWMVLKYTVIVGCERYNIWCKVECSCVYCIICWMLWSMMKKGCDVADGLCQIKRLTSSVFSWLNRNKRLLHRSMTNFTTNTTFTYTLF